MPNPPRTASRASYAENEAAGEAKVSGRVLVVDDQIQPRRLLIDELRSSGFEVLAASDGEEAWQRFCNDSPDVVLTDMAMPRCDGIELLRRVRSRSEVPVIVFSGHGSIDSAAEAIKAGANEFVSSLDHDIDDLVELVREALRPPGAADSLQDIGEHLIGTSAPMQRVRWQLSGLAPLGAPVLVTGEVGTGRSTAIEALHRFGSSAGGPLTRVEAAGFSPPCRLAAPGAVHIANVENLDADAQRYWTKRIHESETESFRDRLRVFASSSLGPLELDGLDQGPDLMRLLSRFRVTLPPLSQRTADIPILAETLVERIGVRLGRPRVRLSPSSRRLLERGHFDENVKQLEEILERSVAFTRGRTILREDLQAVVDDVQKSVDRFRDEADHVKRRELLEALQGSGGNIAEAARQLGKSRSALYRLLRRFQIPIRRPQ